MQHPILNLLILICFFTKLDICFDLVKTDFCLRIKLDKKNADQNKQQILWKKKSGFVNSRLGVPSDEQDIYHQYFHFQLNLCRSCILPNILLKCRKAGCQLATTQWGEIKSEGVSFFCNPCLLQYTVFPLIVSAETILFWGWNI